MKKLMENPECLFFCFLIGLNIIFHFFVFWKAYHKSLKQKKETQGRMQRGK